MCAAMSKSGLEDGLYRLLTTLTSLPPPRRQVLVVPERKWTWDFAWKRLAIECEGGIWARGKQGHSSGSGIQRDIHKSNAGILAGWVCLRYSAKDLQERPVQVLEEITKAYKMHELNQP